MNFTVFGEICMPTKCLGFRQLCCTVSPKVLQVVIIPEAAVVLAELDRGHFKDRAAPIAMLGPGRTAELAEQLLRRRH